ncbi:MAG: AraC family transcriptional regulator [Chloroflexota bacterium]
MSLIERVIHQRSSPHHSAYGQHDALSIKCMFNGSAWYETDDGGRFLVNDDVYFLLNGGQGYWVHKEGKTAVHTFCLFLPKSITEDVLHNWLTPDDKLLQNPHPNSKQPIHFFERCYQHNQTVSPILARLRTQIRQQTLTDLALEEQLHQLLGQLLRQQRTLYRDVESMPAVRLATKRELYRAVQRGREYIHASYGRSISLHDIATAAGLSPHHFLRTFQRTFGQTPHNYLTQHRLQKAQQLLSTTNQTITNICLDVGFSSLGSFSTLFRQAIGLSPRAYRNVMRNA